MQSWNEIVESLVGVKDDLTQMIAQRSVMGARQKALDEMVGLAKGREALQPTILEHLEELQTITHQKSVGVYEELLTAIVNDVLPGQRFIKLDLTTDRSLPALDIEVEKDGKREGISGGALTNIISAGLRVIAMARSGHYPFMVLDEPDCWMKTTRVPQFANVLGQVANEIGIQAILVSHHDPHFFEKMACMIRLVNRGGRVEAEIMGERPVWPEGATGIKTIWLKNFMSHEKTFLELGPGINCITGENDIGKSAIVAALRAIFYGEIKDSAISHDKDSCEVGVEFTDGNKLIFEYFRKASPKRKWHFFVPGMKEALQTGSPKHGVPPWLETVVKIQKTAGMDIALTDQKKPVFLLESTPQERASILSVGRESSHLQRMIAKNKKKAADDRSLIQQGEKEGASIARQLKVLESLPDLVQRTKTLMKEVTQAEQKALQLEGFKTQLDRLKVLATLTDVEFKVATMTQPKMPSLQTVDALKDNLLKYKKLQSWSGLTIKDFAMNSEDVRLVPWEQDLQKCKRWVSLNAKSQIKANFKDQEITIPDLLPWESHLQKANRYRAVSQRAKIQLAVRELDQPSLASYEAVNKKLSDYKKAQRFSTIILQSHVLEKPELENVQASLDKLQNLKGTLARLKKAQAYSEEADRRIEKLKEKSEHLSEQLGGTCPCCQQAWSAEHLKSSLNLPDSKAEHLVEESK